MIHPYDRCHVVVAAAAAASAPLAPQREDRSCGAGAAGRLGGGSQ